jgi:hypothetical protein
MCSLFAVCLQYMPYVLCIILMQSYEMGQHSYMLCRLLQKGFFTLVLINRLIPYIKMISPDVLCSCSDQSCCLDETWGDASEMMLV